MQFKSAPRTEGMSCRWTSENDVWEIGLRPMIYGVRVSAGRVEPSRGFALFYAIDYCAGGDESFLMQLFAVVVNLLSRLPESITVAEVERLFPEYERKPINLDPCWDKLLDLCQMDDPFPGYLS